MFIKEQQEFLDCIADPVELFKELETTHKEVWKIFKENGIEDLSDTDAFYDLFMMKTYAINSWMPTVNS